MTRMPGPSAKVISVIIGLIPRMISAATKVAKKIVLTAFVKIHINTFTNPNIRFLL